MQSPIWPRNIIQKHTVGASKTRPDRPNSEDWSQLEPSGRPTYLRRLVADHTGTDVSRWTVEVWRARGHQRRARVIIGLDGVAWAQMHPTGLTEEGDIGEDLCAVLGALSALSLCVMINEVQQTAA